MERRRPTSLLDDAFNAGLRRLTGRGLSFDASIYHPQLPDVIALATAHPDATIILNHAASPVGHSSYRGKECLPATFLLEHVVDRLGDRIVPGHLCALSCEPVVQFRDERARMNVNEVIANLALVQMGRVSGEYSIVGPNDHVNLSQSTNDVYPTAVRLTVLRESTTLLEALRDLTASLRAKGVEFAEVLKVGRTQLQDAVPMTLGQEFEAFAETVDEDRVQMLRMLELMREVNLGGTAIGTGVNAPAGFASVACRHLSAVSGVEVKPASNLIEATSDTGAFVSISSMLKRIAVKLSKVCNDLRLLSSGPRAGLGEIRLPARQAGSSIMPGKVNPVIPEMMNQINFQVIGNNLTITLAAGAGQLQLNAMEPVMVFNILQSMRLLTRGIDILRTSCIDGIEADVARCRELYDRSLIHAASLNPVVGYNKAATLAKNALASGASLREVVSSDASLSEEQRRSILLLLA